MCWASFGAPYSAVELCSDVFKRGWKNTSPRAGKPNLQYGWREEHKIKQKNNWGCLGSFCFWRIKKRGEKSTGLVIVWCWLKSHKRNVNRRRLLQVHLLPVWICFRLGDPEALDSMCPPFEWLGSENEEKKKCKNPEQVHLSCLQLSFCMMTLPNRCCHTSVFFRFP